MYKFQKTFLSIPFVVVNERARGAFRAKNIERDIKVIGKKRRRKVGVLSFRGIQKEF